jgi:hypothetical protein
MNKRDNFALVPRPPGALEKAEPGAKRVLAGMVQDALALARTKVQAQNIPALPFYTAAELESWFQKGKSYYDGDGVPQDFDEAVKWWRKAAEQGFAAAQWNLAECYYNGEGVRRSCEVVPQSRRAELRRWAILAGQLLLARRWSPAEHGGSRPVVS